MAGKISGGGPSKAPVKQKQMPGLSGIPGLKPKKFGGKSGAGRSGKKPGKQGAAS
jgi:hypothetical protein